MSFYTHELKLKLVNEKQDFAKEFDGLLDKDAYIWSFGEDYR